MFIMNCRNFVVQLKLFSSFSQLSVQTLANLMDEVIRVNRRLEPCLEKCRDLIRNDAVMNTPVSNTSISITF